MSEQWRMSLYMVILQNVVQHLFQILYMIYYCYMFRCNTKLHQLGQGRAKWRGS